MSRFALTKRRILGVAFLCTVLIAGFTIWWNTSHVAEAAVVDPHPGLVGWWRFDEGSGAVASDSSGYGNNGTLNGATWVNGKYGQALSFDGTNDYVQISSSPSLQITDDLTISFWINLDSLATTMVPVDKHWAGEYFVKILTNGGLRFAQGASGNSEELTVLPAGSLVSGQWIHVAVVRSTSDVELTAYKNGVAATPVAYTKTPTASSQAVNIGAEEGIYNRLSGIIDDVRIYNRALSPAEIETLSQKEPEFTSKLLAKVPQGATQIITTLSWQGTGSINATVESPSTTYTEDDASVYQKTVYSTSAGSSGMLNIKRLSVEVNALSSDENWYIVLETDNVDSYQISIEVQK